MAVSPGRSNRQDRGTGREQCCLRTDDDAVYHCIFMPRTKGDRPDVIPDGCTNFAFLGQFAETPRDTVFTTEYSVRTAMEAVYGLLGVDRGVPEVWGSVYDIRELLDSSVKLMDGKSPLEIQLPGPLNALKKPVIKVVKGTVIEKLLRDHGILTEDM